MRQSKNKLAESILSLLDNHPEDWKATTSGVQNKRTNISITKKRFLKAKISLNSYFVVYDGAIARALRKSIDRWIDYKNKQLELESIEEIKTALKDTRGLKPCQAARLKKTGDI